MDDRDNTEGGQNDAMSLGRQHKEFISRCVGGVDAILTVPGAGCGVHQSSGHVRHSEFR